MIPKRSKNDPNMSPRWPQHDPTMVQKSEFGRTCETSMFASAYYTLSTPACPKEASKWLAKKRGPSGAWAIGPRSQDIKSTGIREPGRFYSQPGSMEGFPVCNKHFTCCCTIIFVDRSVFGYSGMIFSGLHFQHYLKL